MVRFSYLLAAGLISAFAVAPVSAQNQNLAPGVGAGKVLRAQLGIKGPTTTQCPNEATATGWVFTNYPGKVTVMIVHKGQGVGAPVILQTVPAANGQHLATYSRKIPIIAPIEAEYRLLVGGGDGVVSNWAPLKATCGIGAGPANIQGG